MISRFSIPVLILCLTAFCPLVNVGADISSITTEETKNTLPAVEILYQRLGEPELPLSALKSTMAVYGQLIKEGRIKNEKVITIIDFNKPSHRDRFFVIDVVSEKILYKCLVAHGKNSGENYATSFSNNLHSYQSSLGFYITGETYNGRHGYSLVLDGIEKGINDNAKKRAVVMHGAAYVSHQYAESHGRLGRSFGCPALPVEMASGIIDTIQKKSLVFIYSCNENYCKNSNLFSSFLSSP